MELALGIAKRQQAMKLNVILVCSPFYSSFITPRSEIDDLETAIILPAEQSWTNTRMSFVAHEGMAG